MQKIFLFFLCYISFSINIYSQQTKSPLVQSYKEHLKLKTNSHLNLKWISLGPVLNSARVESIQVDEKNPGTMYVAFGSGNLWKTTNNGISWKPIFNDVPSIGIGDIALSPSDPNIIYLGTGESLKKARNFTMPGTGIYKSIDAGKTWNHLGLNDSWHIGEISIHPKNPDIVYVSVLGHFWTSNINRGVYRTIDGGKNWDKVLYINEKTGSIDVVISPSNPNIVYASMWENYPSISGKNSGVYKSKDSGKTWKKVTNGLPSGKKTGRIGLAVSYSNANKIYALVDNLANERNNAAEVYSSIDGGKNWSKTHKDNLLIFPGIGWYFADIYVSPSNDNEIYALGVRTAKSSDGGKSFENLRGDVKRLNSSVAKGLHLDNCELWINPLNDKHIALGNDGGLFISYDKGKSWLHYNNIPVGEFYDIEVDNQNPYVIYGGTQDDATVYGPAVEWNNLYKDKWKYLWIDPWDGGDGCVTQVDPSDPNTVYFSMQNGAIRRKDMVNDLSLSIKPKLPDNINDNLEYNFITPYFISEHNNNTLYHAGNYVFKSENRGDNWKLISNNLTKSKFSNKISFSAGAIAESPIEKGVIYYGTDRGSFWVTKNDGEIWEEESINIEDNYIRSICPSKFEKSRVYMSMTGINYDDLNNYIYSSENYGKHWKKISSNLPNESVNVIVEDNKYENILYAGMYRGVYISLNKGLNWMILGDNLPISSVSDIEIHNSSNDMIVSTHGRGIYKINLDPIHKYFLFKDSLKSDYLFEINNGTLPKFNDTHKEPIIDTYEKLPITFYLNENKNYALIIMNDNKVVWKYESEGNYGINQIRWDLITKKNNDQKPYHIHYNEFILPGEYNVILETENSVNHTLLKIYEK